ncbi:hypothetical protein [Aureivirga sp. CE67]|uniref:hypothetical protein n=1 Tax=Aureivirga sp. CE67 TaxID=1788983 RepID=UPI0018CB10A7|nr:hypothetical protein [Aureivirga sp. CE67]
MNNNQIIEKAIQNLKLKIQNLDIQNLDISDYNKKYLSKYKNEFDFYMFSYRQLLQKVLSGLNKSIDETVFVDYGGGCGMLSYLAKEIGFKEVVYNDIYDVSVADVRVISHKIDLPLTSYIHGDIDAFLKGINAENIKPNVICSFDVLEHIYDVFEWMEKIATIDSDFFICSMTSANHMNPLTRKRLSKLHHISEYVGFGKVEGQKEMDLNTSYLAERKRIISKKYPEISEQNLETLAKETRGLYEPLIYDVVEKYLKTNQIDYKMEHPTNTCDPYTGNWTENMIDLKKFTSFIEKDLGYEVRLTNSKYGFSTNAILNIPKKIINTMIQMSGKEGLTFSPTYTLEVYPKK